MIKCPVCHKEVAEDATTCPHCGHILKKKNNYETLLVREHVNYYLDIALMILPYTLILLMLLNNYLLLLAIPLALLCTGWGWISIRKRRINNKIIKNLIYFNKDNQEIICYDLKFNEYIISLDHIVKIHKENLFTNRVFLSYKKIQDDNTTYKIKRLDLGYAKNEDIKVLKTKLKNLVEVDITIEEK